jgi:cell division protein FtsB
VATTHNATSQKSNQWMLPLAIVTALAMLIGWFPLTSLWSQQSQINATKAQIAAIKQEQKSLTLQSDSSSTQTELMIQAREQYQLVLPGQSLIQVLPGLASGALAEHAGDPGFSPVVSPSSVSTLTSVTSPSTGTTHASSNNFFTRFLHTLEFWR